MSPSETAQSHRPGNMLLTKPVTCPYCGEPFETLLDLSAGSQNYVEDCHVCCRPIEFGLAVDQDGEGYELKLIRDDE